MIDRRIVALAILAVVPAACSGALAGGGSAQAAADGVTTSVYADNVAGVTAHFDQQLRAQVSRAEVGALSDKMHALGAYQGLTYVSGDPTKNEFTYRANFANGSMSLVIRMDSNGKLAAYRIFTPT